MGRVDGWTQVFDSQAHVVKFEEGPVLDGSIQTQSAEFGIYVLQNELIDVGAPISGDVGAGEREPSCCGKATRGIVPKKVDPGSVGRGASQSKFNSDDAGSSFGNGGGEWVVDELGVAAIGCSTEASSGNGWC